MLTVIINVRNGERYLRRCLGALTGFSEVVVCDNYSTDATPAIAAEFSNVRFIQTVFNGMGPVRNFAAAAASNDWLLFIDCDEVVSPELASSLRSLALEDGCVYQLYRHNYYAGRWVNSSSWGNDWVTRLYNRRQTSYSAVQVHESVIATNLRQVRLNSGVIYHFPYESAGQLLAKTQSYSDWYAQQNQHKKRPKLWLLPWQTLFTFLKGYLLKGGFRDGYEGLLISMSNAIGVWVKYIKLYELQNPRLIAISVDASLITDWAAFARLVNQQQLLPDQIICQVPGGQDAQLPAWQTAAAGLFVSELVWLSATEQLTTDQAKAPQLAAIFPVSSSQLVDTAYLLKQRQAMAGRR